MKSYIKIYGPPIYKAIKALENLAIDMPELCIWDTVLERDNAPIKETDNSVYEYEADYFFGENWAGEIPEKRCGKIISKSGGKIGEYDFYFEWFKDPTPEDLNNLIEKIDNALNQLGCIYTITTK